MPPETAAEDAGDRAAARLDDIVTDEARAWAIVEQVPEWADQHLARADG
jgi:hypothetical protein